MGCGCGKRRTSDARTVSSSDFSRMIYEVWIERNGTMQFAQRRFSSVIAARSYAARVGGEVRLANTDPD